MGNPDDGDEHDHPNQPHYWERKHYKIQRTIALGGMAGLCVLILQWCQMRDTLRTDQRAWLTVTNAELLKSPAVNEKPLVKINVSNSGRTPALQAKVLGVVYLAAEEPGSVNFGDVSKYPTAVIGPSANISVTVDRPPLGQAEELALRANENGIYAHGEIRYFDIFGRQHHTGFCFMIKQKDFLERAMTACETGNYAD